MKKWSKKSLLISVGAVVAMAVIVMASIFVIGKLTGKDGYTLLEAMRTVDFLHKHTHVTKITVIWVDSLGNRITLPNLY